MESEKMEDTPSILVETTYYHANKKVLLQWLWKIHRVCLLKNHRTLVHIDDSYAGFMVKSGTFYYASLLRPTSK
jgi:hypothetical protein